MKAPCEDCTKCWKGCGLRAEMLKATVLAYANDKPAPVCEHQTLTYQAQLAA